MREEAGLVFLTPRLASFTSIVASTYPSSFLYHSSLGESRIAPGKVLQNLFSFLR
jgi:hypothetical protein